MPQCFAGRSRRARAHVSPIVLLLLAFALPSAAGAAAAAPPDPSGIVDVRVLSDRWICVVVDLTREILAARDAKFGDELAADRAKHDAKPDDDWYYPISAKYHTLLAVA